MERPFPPVFGCFLTHKTDPVEHQKLAVGGHRSTARWTWTFIIYNKKQPLGGTPFGASRLGPQDEARTAFEGQGMWQNVIRYASLYGGGCFWLGSEPKTFVLRMLKIMHNTTHNTTRNTTQHNTTQHNTTQHITQHITQHNTHTTQQHTTHHTTQHNTQHTTHHNTQHIT